MEVKSLGIIGFGSFGEFVSKLTKEKFPNIKVKIYSSKNSPDGSDFFSLEEVCKTDILVLCVPISATEETINKILPHLSQNTIVCDVATVKKYTAELLRNKNVPKFISTHPMFGPYSYAKHKNSLSDLRMAVCDSNLPKNDLDEIIDFLKRTGLKVLEISADEHDKLIAETLFLTHLIGQTVKKAGFERTAVDTLSFGFLMDAVESVANDEKLFRDVAKYNPYCKSVLEKFENAEKEISSSLE